MSVLSAQSIRRLCRPGGYYTFPSHRIPVDSPLIEPFEERGVINGKTFGLGPCSYDVRSKARVYLPAGGRALASTIEKFCIPPFICGTVMDKSSNARVFVSAFNTHIDPGWRGYLTVELVNLDSVDHEWEAGDPLCQIRFDALDEPTIMPYQGKYQDQQDMPVPFLYET